MRSFRARLILGTVICTAGLIPVGHLLALSMLRHSLTLRSANHALLATVALGLIAAGLIQIRRGLSPFDQLRERLSALRAGRERNLEGDYPSEVQPLVNDLNALLEHRERVVARALAKAGDLAHGLKTPLTILAQEGARAERLGQHETAAAIEQQVERMRRQIDYHLAQARAVASGATRGARCSIAASTEALVRTLQRLHVERQLTIETAVAPESGFRGEREDLEEMLGNLLDNACKWGRTRVRITASQHDEIAIIEVDDDGSGLEPSLRERVMQRGVRADEAAPGSGLGLAIVRDLAELYGGSVTLSDSPLGGLRARLQLPAA